MDTSPVGIEPMSALLEQQGVEGLIIDDESDFHNFLENNHQYWDYVDENHNYGEVGCILSTLPYNVSESGYGYMEEYEIARRYRDIPVAAIYAGTTEIMKGIIAKHILK